MVAIVDRKLVGVDAVKIVQRERRQIAGSCDRYLGLALLQISLCGPKFRAFGHRQILHFAEGSEGADLSEVVYHAEVLPEIGKDQNRQRKTGFVDGQLGIQDVALMLLDLHLRLHHVGMRRFSTLFQFLRCIQELLRVL